MGTAGPGTASSPAACSGGSGRCGVPDVAVGAGSVSRTDDAREGRGATAAFSFCLGSLPGEPCLAAGVLDRRPQLGQVGVGEPEAAGGQPAVDLGGPA